MITMVVHNMLYSTIYFFYMKKGTHTKKSASAKAIKLPHRVGRGGMALAVARFVRDDQERRIQAKIDAGMPEGEARDSTHPMHEDEIENFDLFLKARELKDGGYGDEEPMTKFVKDLVSVKCSCLLVHI